jgi:hypothetical protein
MIVITLCLCIASSYTISTPCVERQDEAFFAASRLLSFLEQKSMFGGSVYLSGGDSIYLSPIEGVTDEQIHAMLVENPHSILKPTAAY